jgi:Peptidase A4 family
MRTSFTQHSRWRMLIGVLVLGIASVLGTTYLVSHAAAPQHASLSSEALSTAGYSGSGRRWRDGYGRYSPARRRPGAGGWGHGGYMMMPAPGQGAAPAPTPSAVAAPTTSPSVPVATLTPTATPSVPTASPVPTAPAPTTPVPAGPALADPATPVPSMNWAGYAATGSRFTSVSASWTEPAATCSATNTFASFWVGLDGDGTQSVEQTGTEADCDNGTAAYSGWFEMFPAAPVFYANPVRPGDAMSASVTTTGDGTFTLTLTDQTQGWNQVTTQTSQTAQLGSAEIIAEAPSSTAGVEPLTNFGTANFTAATANGVPIGDNATLSELTLVSAAGTAEATPSALTGASAFSVTWDSSGGA